ncbi:hypothetical protein OAQ15_04015 [Flavobacteriaceae bacterium]|nr:hypothetical protein [Flavobacteriaceae bacterium]
MNLQYFPTKNRFAKPLKWEKSEARVSDSVVGTSTGSASQFFIRHPTIVIDFIDKG